MWRPRLSRASFQIKPKSSKPRPTHRVRRLGVIRRGQDALATAGGTPALRLARLACERKSFKTGLDVPVRPLASNRRPQDALAAAGGPVPERSRRDAGATLPVFLYIDLRVPTAHNPLVKAGSDPPRPPVPDIRMATPNVKFRLVFLRAHPGVAWSTRRG